MLAQALVVGTSPDRQIVAVKLGRARRYASRGLTVEHVGVTPDLLFGFTVREGVRYADVEKAVVGAMAGK